MIGITTIDKYILKSYLGTLASFFFILMFIFIIQTVWVFIDEFAGKGLNILVLFKFLIFYSPKLIPLVLPLTILLSSIMTFGGFAEKQELSALKSAGISLSRAMRPLIVVNFFASFLVFYITNTVIPLAEYKTFNLRKNLSKVQPALAITEGMFNDIGEINIKVEKKYGENDRFLEDIIIHENSANQVNRVVIKSKKGELKNNDFQDGIQLILFDGYRYEEVYSKKKTNKSYPHNRVYFEKYTMNIDLSSFNNVDLNEARYTNTFKMQNVNELNYSIDSLTTKYLNEIKGYSNTVYLRTGAKSISNFKNKNKSVVFVGGYDYLKNFSQRQKEMILVTARNNINMQLKNFSNQKNVFFIREKVINLHRIWRDDKFVTAFSAFIFFIIGAPIGALIKKGGLGLPTVTALIIFLIYHFTGTFLKNSAEDGSLNPLIGAWTMTIIITILAMLIFVRANNDKPLINISNLRLRVFFKK